jgi:uncharacterized protein YeaO (DUF488 family)
LPCPGSPLGSGRPYTRKPWRKDETCPSFSVDASVSGRAGHFPMIRIKRTYEPASPEDGKRILVDRLWPRGVKKASLHADAWLKEAAPSTELRQWFAHRTEHWDGFRHRYREELANNSGAWQPILEATEHGTVTLLYSAHDDVHNGARVLRDFLLERQSHGAPMPGTRRGTSPRNTASRGGRLPGRALHARRRAPRNEAV